MDLKKKIELIMSLGLWEKIKNHSRDIYEISNLNNLEFKEYLEELKLENGETKMKNKEICLYCDHAMRLIDVSDDQEDGALFTFTYECAHCGMRYPNGTGYKEEDAIQDLNNKVLNMDIINFLGDYNYDE